MREEISHWWEQAKRDLTSARNSHNAGDYYVAAFLCHQSLEKGLKAYIMYAQKESSPTHSLVRLGRIAGVPDTFNSILKELTTEYFISRYPDAIDDVPYKQYNEEDTKGLLERTKEVLTWLDTQMNR